MFGPRIAQAPAYGDHLRPPPQPTCSPYVFGVNAVFLPLIPYTLAAAIHDDNVHLALILATAFSGGILLYGLLAKAMGGHKTWPYALELCMLVVNAVCLGVSYAQEHDIQKYYTFIANSVYSAFGVLSLILAWPFTVQYSREFVPGPAEGHDLLVRTSYQTTSGFTLAFVLNTLLYLIPICKGKWDNHDNALNLVFRIILPIFFYLFATIFARAWPVRVLNHLRLSGPFDGAVRKVQIHTNPLASNTAVHVHAMAV